MELFEFFIEIWSHRNDNVLLALIIYSPFVCLILGIVITYLEHRDAVCIERTCAYYMGEYKDALSDFDHEVELWEQAARRH